MRILTLNCWGGKKFSELMALIERERLVNVWCFQEVPLGTRAETNVRGIRDNLIDEIAKRLPRFKAVTHALPVDVFQGEQTRHGTNVGMAIFVPEDWECEVVMRSPLYPEDSEHARTPGLAVTGHLFGVKLKRPRDYGRFVIGNVHGLWHKDGKVDVPERLEQSRRLLEFYRQHDKQNLPVVLAGDFNLALDIESTRMLDRELRNLIREFAIRTTRTSLYEPAYTKRDPHADYVFTSHLCSSVQSCRTLPDVVSDHAAVVADITPF